MPKPRVRSPSGAPSAPRHVRVTALDPRAKCGTRTTVEQLYRVEERAAEGRVIHLVFNDRHGWYCLHGAACPAVGDVRRYLEPPRRRPAADARTRRARGG